MIGPKMDLTANTIATSGDTLILPAPLFYWRTPTQLERQFSRINDQDTWKQDLSVEYNFIFTICKTSSFSPHRRICAMRLEQATLNWWPIHTACSYLSFSIAKLPWRGGRLIRVASEKGLLTLMEIWPHLPFCGIRSRTIWNISKFAAGVPWACVHYVCKTQIVTTHKNWQTQMEQCEGNKLILDKIPK